MGLTIRSKRHGGILITLMAVFALVAQPMYGFVAAQVANAVAVPGDVVINEFSADNGTDWVELYNKSAATVDLAGWKLRDSSASNKVDLTGALPAGGFLAVDFGSSLNQAGDTIRILDASDMPIDELTYPGAVAAPASGSYAARLTDGATTWEIRAAASKGLTNVTAPVVTPPSEVTISSVAELRTAIENQADGQTWTIQPGSYGLEKFSSITAEGQTGWYFPITANNLTINGVGNPTIYGVGHTPNGNWSTQNFVSVFGDNIIIDGVTLMPKVQPNKTVEVLGTNFTLRNSTIAPNTISMADYAGVDAEYQQWGGSLYFNNAGNHTLHNVTIKNAGISYRHSPSGTNIAMSGVVIENTSNLAWVNDYRYSSGFNNSGNSVTGAPSVVYHVNNALNNLEQVLASVKTGDIIELDSDIISSKQMTVNTDGVTINGNGHTINGAFAKTDGSNNSVLTVSSDNVTINALGVDAATGTDLHGFNVYQATNVALNNIVAKNGRTGVVVNGSTVTVDSATTSGNTWHGINVDKPGAILTIKGTNSHTEVKQLYVDNRTVGQVVDVDNRYAITVDPTKPTADIYGIDATAPIVSWQKQPLAYYGIGAGFHVRPINPEANVTKSVYFDAVAPENLCSSLTSVHKNFDMTNAKCQTQWDSLTDGTHKFVAVFTDTAGNASVATDSAKFVIDRTKPTVKVNLNRTSYATSGDVISKVQNAEIEARDTNLDRVELWKNGVITGHVWTASDTKRLANIKFLGEGSYTVKAFDKAGNQSDEFSFTVDNTAPAAPVIVDNSVFVKIGQANKTLEWNHNGVDTATYEYREYTSYANAVSDTAYWTKTLNTPQLSTTDTASATSKKLYWRVVAIDAVGNRSALSEIGAITIDRDKPVVTGSIETEYNPASFTITATDNFEVARVTGNLYNAATNTLLEGNSSTTENPFTVDLTSLDDGTYYVKYNAQDEAGNISNTLQFQFTVDHTLPVITVKDDYVGDKAAAVFSQVSFKLHDAQMADKYTINTHEVNFTNNKWSDANFQNIKQYLVEGINTITLYDTAGNSNSYAFVYDSTKPTVVLREDQTIKPSGSYFLTSKTIRVQPQDANRGKLFVNGVEYPQYFGSGSFGINWIVANYPGVEKFVITAQDRAGNMSGEYIVMVDRTAPTITVKAGTGANDGSLVGIDDWYRQISFKLYDKNGNLKQVELNGNVYTRGGTWNDLNWLNINKNQLVQGENTVVVHDHEGNSRELKFNYDSVVPTATFSYSNNNGNALTRDDVVVTMTTSEPVQTPTDWTRVSDQIFTRTYADNGKHSVVVADRAGNESAVLKYEVKRIDRGAPTIDGVLDGATVRGAVTLVVADPKYQGVDGFDQNTGLKINGGVVVTTPGDAKTYLYTLSQAGNYTVVATDKAGNSKTITFTIDNSITLTINPVASTTTTPTITGAAHWNADATPAANQSVSIEVRRNGSVVHVLGPVQTNGAGEWSVQVPALATGSYDVYAAIGGAVAGDAIVGPEVVSVVVPPTVQRGTGSPVATANPGIPTIPVQNPQQLNTNFLAFATTTATPAVTNSSDSEDAEVRGLSTVASTATEDNEDGEVKAAEDAKPTWSLVNVLLAAAAVVMGLMALLGLFGKKEEGEEAMNGRRVVVIVLGVSSIAGLLFLEDFGGSMSVADVWSLAFAVLVAVQLAIITSLKRAA